MKPAPKALAKFVEDPAAAGGVLGVLVVATLRALLGRAPFPAPPKCACGAPRDLATLLCVEGCDKYRKPHVAARRIEAQQRERERVAVRAVGIPRDKLHGRDDHMRWSWGNRRKGSPTS